MLEERATTMISDVLYPRVVKEVGGLLTAEILRDIVSKVNPSALEDEALSWLHEADNDARMLKTDVLEALRAASLHLPENRVLSTLFPSEFTLVDEEPVLPGDSELVTVPEQDDNRLVPETIANEQPTPTPPSYIHPAACRSYLDSEVVPLLKQGLAALLEEVQRIRLAEASGEAWSQEEGFLPPDWAPFSPLRWLANWLDSKRPTPNNSYGSLSQLERASLAFSALAEAEVLSLLPSSVFYNKLSIDKDLVDSVLASHGLDGDLNAESFSQVLVDLSSAMSLEEPLVILDIAVLRATGPYALLNRCNDPADQRRLAFLILLQGHLQLNVLSSSTSTTLPSDQFQNLLARLAPQASFTPTTLSSLTLEDFDAEIIRLWDNLNNALSVDKDQESEPLGVQIVLSAIEQLHGLPSNLNQNQPSPFDEVESAELSDLVREIYAKSNNVKLVAASQVLDPLAAQRIAGGDATPFLLIDLRTKEEYEVSCIPGAIHLETRVEANGWKLVNREAAMEKLAEAYALAFDVSQQRSSSSMNANLKRRQPLPNRLPTVITYCDIGHRSFNLADEIAVLLAEALGLDSKESVLIYSLCGGIINFYNAGGRVVTVKGGEEVVVNAVHPGSEENKNFITRRNAHH